MGDLINYLMEIDLGIMLPGANPSHIEYAAMQEVLKSDKGRTIHFHWSGAYDILGESLEIDSVINEYYQKVFLETDYLKLGRVQRSFEEAIRNEWVRVTTPLGTNIKFNVGTFPYPRDFNMDKEFGYMASTNYEGIDISLDSTNPKWKQIEKEYKVYRQAIYDIYQEEENIVSTVKRVLDNYSTLSPCSARNLL